MLTRLSAPWAGCTNMGSTSTAFSAVLQSGALPVQPAKEQPFKASRGKLVAVPGAVREQVLLKVAYYIALANALYRINVPVPTCSFDLRGRASGMAHYREHHIRFNPVLLNENTEAFLAQTPGHEVAHLVTLFLHAPGRKRRPFSLAPHGPQWQEVMRDFGLQPRATHNFVIDNATISTRLFAYRCSCPDKVFKFGPRKHANAKRAKYFCRQCLGQLRFDAQIK